MKKNIKTRIANAFIYGLMLLSSFICLFPFIYVFNNSISDPVYVIGRQIYFIPRGVNLDAYEVIFRSPSLYVSYGNTILYTVIGTLLGTIVTLMCAYPLSRPRLMGKRFLTIFFLITMYFSGGTIPIYLNVKEFGMLDSMWSLIIPGLISTFNVIILKNFFSSLPYELVEAASIDGATDFQVLTRIFLPLSFSSLATLSLFYAVGKWNSFNDALYYITSRELQPLQLKLYNLIKGSQSVEVAVAEGSSNDLSTSVSESIQSATIIFATLPILIVYPFVQRYFVAGVTMGAVKG